MPVILGQDFAKTYHIGINWNMDSVPYLCHRGKYLVTAHPLQSMHIRTVVNQLRTNPPMVNLMKDPQQPMSAQPAKRMLHLITKMQVRLKPKALSVVPVEAVGPLNIYSIKTLDVMGYPNFYNENPNLAVIPTTHTKLHKRKTSYLILLVMNNADEENILQKGITLGLATKSKWRIKSSRTARNTQQQSLQVNTVQLEEQPEVDPVQVQKSLENTAFVTRYNTYTKPQVKLKDAEVPEAIHEGFKKLKEEFKDIISQGPSDIGVTNLAEMTIDTKPDSIPHAMRPYKLALQHQEFL